MSTDTRFWGYQEYRFDTTISEKKYVSAETSNNVLKRFPKKRDGQDLEVPTDFVVNSTPILGPFSESVVPMERVFFGLLRIDHGGQLLMCLRAAAYSRQDHNGLVILPYASTYTGV